MRRPRLVQGRGDADDAVRLLYLELVGKDLPTEAGAAGPRHGRVGRGDECKLQTPRRVDGAAAGLRSRRPQDVAKDLVNVRATEGGVRHELAIRSCEAVVAQHPLPIVLEEASATRLLLNGDGPAVGLLVGPAAEDAAKQVLAACSVQAAVPVPGVHSDEVGRDMDSIVSCGVLHAQGRRPLQGGQGGPAGAGPGGRRCSALRCRHGTWRFAWQGHCLVCCMAAMYDFDNT